MKTLICVVLQLALSILLAPLLSGIIRKIKALSQHRKGLPVLQVYYDLSKLFKKDVVVSENTSWLFKATPYIYIVTVLVSLVFIPAIPQLFTVNFAGDAIFVLYFLSLGRFFITLAGLDAGSTFGGMGSSREMMISTLIEPSLIIMFFTLGLNSGAGSTSFQAIYEGSINAGFNILTPGYILLFVVLLIALIAETARIPVDDPATHLELTMVHEAMILEYSGRYLALIELASCLKQFLFITIIVNVFLPFGSSFVVGSASLSVLLLFVLKVILITVIIALIEIKSVKLRLFSVPNLAAVAFILSVLGFMSSFVLWR